jgi:hypothetical protein
MMASHTPVPKNISSISLRHTLWERIRTKSLSLQNKFLNRLEKSKVAFQNEYRWQQACKKKEILLPLQTKTQILSGLAIHIDSGEYLPLTEGVNRVAKDTLRLENGEVTWIIENGKSQILWTNDVFTWGGREYVLKLFPGNRFSRRNCLAGDVL